MSRRSGGTLRSIAGTDARDGALTAELSGCIKEGGSKASIDPRSERPFNEERQFGEAKLPVFEMEREIVATGEAGRGPFRKSFGGGTKRQDGQVAQTLTPVAHNVMPISERP